MSTHAATLRCTVRGIGGAASDVILFNGRNDGARDITWDGLGGDARLAAPGRYEVLVVGQSQIVSRADSAHIFLELTYDVESLEDTLGDLAARDLLPERYGRGAAAADLAKGAGVAAGALAIGGALASDQLGSNDVAPVVAGVALAAFELALQLAPTHIAALVGKGKSLSALERYQEALAVYEQAARLEPSNQTYYLKMQK